MTEQSAPSGPDLAAGIPIASLDDGQMLAGHVGEDSVLLARQGDTFYAIGANCTHYGGPLAEGLMDGETVRCPWHHACFSLRTGEALHAPALSPVPCWPVERRGDKIFVRSGKHDRPPEKRAPAKTQVEKIVIVGGGAAGFAAADILRRQQWQGRLVMVSNDDTAPVDRPNLSKDYLAGSAPEEWIPLKPESFYREQDIDLKLNAEVARIEPTERRLVLASGERIAYDRLLLATGAEPVRLSIPGAEKILTLRSLADSRAIIARGLEGARAVVLGASFIGLEVAASLMARKMEVHVVAPEDIPMARILGPELGQFVRALHEEHGVVFHLGATAKAFEEGQVLLSNGESLAAGLVVAGVGVRPRLRLAEEAGLALDRGVTVDACLETSAPGIYAAGDIARWPDPSSGERIRVEHWVVAERQGQAAALNMLGARQKFDSVPFFWSQHYDVPIAYVGHAESWDGIETEGDIAARDCILRFKRQGRVVAAASIFRDRESLMAEVAMEAHA